MLLKWEKKKKKELQVDAYNSGRPEYPLDEVRHQVQSLGAEGDVIDLGAGSGKLTKGTQKVGFHTLYHLFFSSSRCSRFISFVC